MRNSILFFLLLFSGSLSAQLDQFRMIGSASWTVDSPTNYSATVTFQSDLTANGFLPTGITDTMQVFTQTGQIYTISSAANLTFSTADLVIVESGGDWGTPVGQLMIYETEGRSSVPAIPFGATGSVAKMQEAVDSYNSRLIGSGSGSVSSVNGNTGVVVLNPDDLDDAVTTNKFTTAAEISKLTGIESGATADQSDAEIETAYNNQVSIVSQAEAEAGTATTVRRWTAERVAQAIASRSISSVSTYTEIRASTGNAVFFVTNDRQRGFFVPVDTVATDNGYTILSNSTGQKYLRIYDPFLVYLSWGEVSGDWGDVQKAKDAATVGGKITFEPVVYDSVSTSHTVTDIEIDLNGAYIKATEQYFSAITSNTSNTITVQDASDFKINQLVSFGDGDSDSDIGAYSDGANDALITNVTGNIITISRSITGDISGDTLFLTSPFFCGSEWGIDRKKRDIGPEQKFGGI